MPNIDLNKVYNFIENSKTDGKNYFLATGNANIVIPAIRKYQDMIIYLVNCLASLGETTVKNPDVSDLSSYMQASIGSASSITRTMDKYPELFGAVKYASINIDFCSEIHQKIKSIIMDKDANDNSKRQLLLTITNDLLPSVKNLKYYNEHAEKCINNMAKNKYPTK